MTQGLPEAQIVRMGDNVGFMKGLLAFAGPVTMMLHCQNDDCKLQIGQRPNEKIGAHWTEAKHSEIL